MNDVGRTAAIIKLIKFPHNMSYIIELQKYSFYMEKRKYSKDVHGKVIIVYKRQIRSGLKLKTMSGSVLYVD